MEVFASIHLFSDLSLPTILYANLVSYNPGSEITDNHVSLPSYVPCPT